MDESNQINGILRTATASKSLNANTFLSPKRGVTLFDALTPAFVSRSTSSAKETSGREPSPGARGALAMDEGGIWRRCASAVVSMDAEICVWAVVGDDDGGGGGVGVVDVEFGEG